MSRCDAGGGGSALVEGNDAPARNRHMCNAKPPVRPERHRDELLRHCPPSRERSIRPCTVWPAGDGAQVEPPPTPTLPGQAGRSFPDGPAPGLLQVLPRRPSHASMRRNPGPVPLPGDQQVCKSGHPHGQSPTHTVGATSHSELSWPQRRCGHPRRRGGSSLSPLRGTSPLQGEQTGRQGAVVGDVGAGVLALVEHCRLQGSMVLVWSGFSRTRSRG